MLAAVILGVTLLWLHAAGLAFTLAGLHPVVALGVLLASLLGSAVNVPVARMRGRRGEIGYRTVRAYHLGYEYIVPTLTPTRTRITVNVGGACVPFAVSAYLAVRTGLWVQTVVAVSVVAIVVHLVARPLPRVGIVLPALVPAVVAAAAAIILQPAHDTGAVAYIGGTLGTLIGADFTHLGAIRRSGARVASIGGGGTFDAVFISGVIAVLLAALF